MNTLSLLITLCLGLILHCNCGQVTFNAPFSIPDNDYVITPNSNGTFTVAITTSGWVASDAFAMDSDNSSFYVVVTSATNIASAGIILLNAFGDSQYYSCGSDSGYNYQSSLVGIPPSAPDTAPCGVADIATIYSPTRAPGSTSSINGVAALNVPQNFQFNYYPNNPNAACIEVNVGAESVNQGGNCDNNGYDNDLQSTSQFYGVYLEVESPGVATFLVGNGFLCQANCTNCTAYNICTACSPGYTLNGTQCVPTPSKPTPTCSQSCSKCDYSQTVMSGGKQYYACARCPYGQYINPDRYECSSCPSNCSTCVSATQCLSCAPGYISQGCKCVQPTCSPTCSVCSYKFFVPGTTNYPCLVCPRGTYVKPNLYECQACPSQCTSCFGSSFCLSCSPGYVLFNFRCVKLKFPWQW